MANQTKRYDFLVVGAGPFGCAFARTAADLGKRVLVIDKREHIAGNAYDERVEGINIHRYGAHIFHTNNAEVWNFVNQFGEFLPYEHRVRAINDGCAFSMPINLSLMNRLWGACGPADAISDIARRCGRLLLTLCDESSIEGWCLANIGKELYELCVKHYTEKQWGRPCRDLPASIIRRLPVRMNYDDRYFADRYQGVPAAGYTTLFSCMLAGIQVETGVEFKPKNRDRWLRIADRIIYSGPIDALFGYHFGPLAYRSLRFETRRETGDVIGCPVLNYTGPEVPWTRELEWKHFERLTCEASYVTREFSQDWQPGVEPFYPVRDHESTARLEQYNALLRANRRILCGGRLGSYRYFDMHQVIPEGIALARKVCQ